MTTEKQVVSGVKAASAGQFKHHGRRSIRRYSSVKLYSAFAALLVSTALCAPALAQQTVLDTSQTISAPVTYAGGVLIANGSSTTVNITGAQLLTAQNNGAWDLIGGVSGVTGTVNVNGGSWYSAVVPGNPPTPVGGQLAVGGSGSGILNITNGGTVGVSFINIAQNGGSTGTVLVDGAGSVLNANYSSNGGVTIGTDGTGTLTVRNGGHVNSTVGTIGFTARAVGTVNITGSGSQWNVATQIYVGENGNGTLNITNGGTVASNGGSIASPNYSGGTGATGNVNVSGAGSVWNAGATSSISMGTTLFGAPIGVGNIVVSDGGQVIAGKSIDTACVKCTINIGAMAGNAAAAAGTIVTPSITLGQASDQIVFNHTDNSGSYTFTPAIKGAGNVVSYSGVTVMGGASSYTGGTAINGGTLQISADNNLGAAAGALSFDGGTLKATQNIAMTRPTTLNAGGGIIDVVSGKVLTMNGAVNGAGALTKTDAGTLVLAGANGYAGGTAINGGTVQISADNNLGAASGALSLDGGTLATTQNISTSRATTLNAGGGTFNVASGTTLTEQAAIGGAGALTKTNGGTMVLTADNTYAGGTTISSGTLQLGNGGTSGSITGDITDNGTLAFNRSDVSTVPGAISGTGSVTQIGSGTTVLTADNTYTGGTTISGGTLQLGNGGTSGSITGNVTDNATLAFDRSDIYTFNGAISGTGGVDQIGSGTTVLTAANTYGGPTNVQTGTLQAGAVNAFSPNSSVTVANGATLDLAGFNQTVAGLNNAGQVNMGTNTPPGTLLTVHGNYAGQNGTIAMNTYLGADGSASDRLVVDGGRASGSTLLDIRNAGGPGAQTNGDGIMVVQALNGATTNTGTDDHSTFQLAHRVAAGAYEYALQANGVANTNDQNWYLRSRTTIVNPPSDYTATPTNTGDPAPAPRVVQVPRPEIPTDTVILPLALQYGYAMLGTLEDRGGLSDGAANVNGNGNSYGNGAAFEQRSVWCKGKNPQDQNALSDPNNRFKCIVRVPVAQDATRWASSGWAQVIGSRGSHDQDHYWRSGPDYDYTFGGIKAGLDIYARQQADGTLDKAGVYAGYGRVNSNVFGSPDAYYGHKAGTVDMDAYTAGGYWTHLSSQGWYTDATVQGTWYTNTAAKSVLNETISPDGFGLLGSLEGGYQFRLGSGWTLTPQAQIAYEHVVFEHAIDSFGVFRFQDGDSLRGRLGARLAKTWNMSDAAHPRLVTASLRANIWHEFLGNTRTSVIGLDGANALTTPSSLKGTWGQVGVGVKAQVSDNISLFTTADYQHSLDNRGMQGWDGRVGVTVKW